jgi:hypothetical protein
MENSIYNMDNSSYNMRNSPNNMDNSQREIMKKIIFVLSLFLFTNVNAEITIKYFVENKDSVIVESMITGMGNGISATNAMLKYKKQPQLFCPPTSIALNYKNMVNIIENEIKRQGFSKIENEILSPFMMMGYIAEFPCKK